MIGWYLECSSHVFFRCGRKANNITHTCYRACYELNIVSKMFLGKVSFQLLLPSSFVVVVVVKLTTLISFLSVLTPHNLILHVYCPFHRTHTRYFFVTQVITNFYAVSNAQCLDFRYCCCYCNQSQLFVVNCCKIVHSIIIIIYVYWILND